MENCSRTVPAWLYRPNSRAQKNLTRGKTLAAHISASRLSIKTTVKAKDAWLFGLCAGYTALDFESRRCAPCALSWLALSTSGQMGGKGGFRANSSPAWAEGVEIA
jgi:hypothetical protein